MAYRPLEQLEENAMLGIIKLALAEDIGPRDVTTDLLIPKDAQAEIAFVAREDMVVCGTFIPKLVYRAMGATMQIEIHAKEGSVVSKGDVIVKLSGPAQAILSGERVALNLMQRMSGVASVTRAFNEAIKGTSATILDTRKTMPGLRMFDKYAVRVGGAENHRLGLYDVVLIKDNHIALAGGIAKAVATVRAGTELPIEVECDTFEQVNEALAAKPDRIMLDNMDTDMLRRCVALVEGAIDLEASGGVTLDTVRGIAETGVKYISVGRLTHSAPSMDIGADLVVNQ